MYHSHLGLGNEVYENDDQAWLDLGQDTPEEIDIAIRNAVIESEQNDISAHGKKLLREMLVDYRDVLRLRLGNGPPADAESMKVELK